MYYATLFYIAFLALMIWILVTNESDNSRTSYSNMTKPDRIRMDKLQGIFRTLSRPEMVTVNFNTPLLTLDARRMWYPVTEGLPPSYTSKRKTPVLNQGSCGSCYAFIVADLVANKLVWHNRRMEILNLSPKYVMSCYDPVKPCSGHSPEKVFEWAEQTNFKFPTLYTVPYDMFKAIKDQNKGDCPPVVGKAMPRVTSHHTLTEWVPEINSALPEFTEREKKLIARNVKNMKSAILYTGPIWGSISVYADFLSVDSDEIYEPLDFRLNTRRIGGHAIIITGWGTSPSGGWWECKNTMGTKFGDNGYFRIRMGLNTCGIESRCGNITITDTDAV